MTLLATMAAREELRSTSAHRMAPTAVMITEDMLRLVEANTPTPTLDMAKVEW